ncbi:E7 [Macaca fascicularis papillomavirus 1]|uniref:Protein E7 n=1 Tax=Macaca fascicularis papillomavirus 1 TaxID=2847841 RepID=A2T934_9PAPI|nr:E7 [Macaca fascicularis papillomavirus 1]
MIGKEVTLQDIVLELKPQVEPDLFCDEELPGEEEEEEEPVTRNPFKVLTSCGGCETKLRLFVVATESGIREFQELLFGDLILLCPECRRAHLQPNGGR